MNDTVLKTIGQVASQVPALLVLCVLVWMNNGQLERLAAKQIDTQKATNEVLRQACTVMDRCERTFALKGSVNDVRKPDQWPSDRVAQLAKQMENE